MLLSAHPTSAPISPASHNGHAAIPNVHPRHAAHHLRDIHLILRRHFAATPEFQHTTHAIGPAPNDAAMVDMLFLSAHDPHSPDDVFDRLRWGGQLILVSPDRDAIQSAAAAYDAWRINPGERGAWVIEQYLASEKRYIFNLRFLGSRAPLYFMVARKIMLIPPGRSSDRFTYNVFLDRNRQTGQYEVVKEVPTTDRVLARLREKFPDADEETLRRRARKFTEKIFPVFLTRETAILKLLQRDLPIKFRRKVPQLISADFDAQGFAHAMRMNWLRNARAPVHGQGGNRGRPLTQLEFARQSAELLAALHDAVGVMHLDLRLDNFVITQNGVGFIDFGSSVRVGEEFPDASLLSNLFEEMMRTSQIQRMLGKMTESKQVTSEEICNSFGKIDKAVDFFYLAVQINSPHANPDFRGLVEHDPQGQQSKQLAKLTADILRPPNPAHPRFTSAQEILHGIEEINVA